MARRPDLGYFDEGFDLTDPALLSAGQTLPPVAYRSLHFSYLEDETIWSNGWVAIGTICAIPDPGDILPYTAGYHGIHVQRQEDGSLLGRFNMAQHGGCRMVPAQCQNGTKTKCSFTSCGYSRDRGAISGREEAETPRLSHQYLGLRPERLNQVAVTTLGPIIFVNIDPAARLVAPEARMQVPGDRIDEIWIEVEANWKLTAETLCLGLGEARSDRLDVTRARGDGSELSITWTFPNLVTLRDQDSHCIVVLQPTALGKTLMRVEVFATRAGPHDWRADLELAADHAQGAQGALTQDTPPGGAAARWLQRQVTSRIAAMPKADFDLPMSQPIRSYMR